MKSNVFWSISTIFYFTDLFIHFIQNAKKEQGLQVMFNRSNFDRKSLLSGILTEPLNPLVASLRKHSKDI